jgi:thioredoxin reductase
MTDTDVAVIGGGPAGLSAALFTAKNGLDTVVFDTDETRMNDALLKNYLGIEEIRGTEFMEIARGQVEAQGGEIHEDEVTGVEQTIDGFEVSTEFDEIESRYLVLATGYARELASELGCEFEEVNETEVVKVNRNNETTVEGAYAAGWTVRPDKIQAAISVGGGAVAGLDILSTERGSPFHDFDVPDDA